MKCEKLVLDTGLQRYVDSCDITLKGTKLCVYSCFVEKEAFLVFIWPVNFYACFGLRVEVAILRVCPWVCSVCLRNEATQYSNRTPKCFVVGRETARNSRNLISTLIFVSLSEPWFDLSQQTKITQFTNQEGKGSCEKLRLKQTTCGIGSVPDWLSTLHNNSF